MKEIVYSEEMKNVLPMAEVVHFYVKKEFFFVKLNLECLRVLCKQK